MMNKFHCEIGTVRPWHECRSTNFTRIYRMHPYLSTSWIHNVLHNECLEYYSNSDSRRFFLRWLVVQEVRDHIGLEGINRDSARSLAIKCCHRNQAQPVLIDKRSSILLLYIFSTFSYKRKQSSCESLFVNLKLWNTPSSLFYCLLRSLS